MVIGSSLFGTGFIYISEHKIHPISTGLLRGLANIFVSYFLGLKQGIDLTFNSSFNFKWQAIRNIIMIVSGLGYTWSLFFLPLPVALTIQSTSLIFTTFFDRVINKTRLNRRQDQRKVCEQGSPEGRSLYLHVGSSQSIWWFGWIWHRECQRQCRISHDCI